MLIPTDKNQSRRRVIRALLVICGTVCVGLGVFGIFIPVLPTTPFLLLAAACYARGSERFYRWLMNNRWCGDYIRNYREGKGISLRHKICAIALLWLTIGYTAVWVVRPLWLRILLCGIAAGVTVHLAMIRTRGPEE